MLLGRHIQTLARAEWRLARGQIVYLLVHERTIHFTVVDSRFHIVLMQLNAVLLEHTYRVKKELWAWNQ